MREYIVSVVEMVQGALKVFNAEEYLDMQGILNMDDAIPVRDEVWTHIHLPPYKIDKYALFTLILSETRTGYLPLIKSQLTSPGISSLLTAMNLCISK